LGIAGWISEHVAADAVGIPEHTPRHALGIPERLASPVGIPEDAPVDIPDGVALDCA
jgi:hypothetical protein